MNIRSLGTIASILSGTRRVLKWTGLTLVAFILGANFGWPSPRDVAFRDTAANAGECVDWRGSDILSKYHNDELELVAHDPEGTQWGRRLRCVLQRHSVGTEDAASPLVYNLAFLEFQENADPYFAAQARNGSAAVEAPKSQLDQIKIHMEHVASRGKHNYVLAFIHGWRHDASLGDTNVADARLYGASAARHLAFRCAAAGGSGPYCDAEVTVVYVGWRGQRVNENGMARAFFGWESSDKQSFGWLIRQAREMAESLAAILTLFDRKPISEQIGPSVVTALRDLSATIHASDRTPGPHFNRLVVIGHSLGGNLLASSLRDYVVRMVHRRTDDLATTFPSPVGDLVVMINAASEAENWTAIQRAVLEKIAFRESEAVGTSTTAQGHRFFPDDQSPVLISITSARSWPPGGFRTGDCAWLARTDRGKAEKIEPQKQANKDLLKENVNYDWATFDLFPAFKGDFRPVASSVDRFSFRMEGVTPRGLGCEMGAPEQRTGLLGRSTGWIGHQIASFLRVLPFMNTNPEQTRTIGHLDPTRPPMRVLTDFSVLPFSQIGTTHQLTSIGTGITNGVIDDRETYSLIGTSRANRFDCEISTNWLWRAKAARKDAERARINAGDAPYATFWDTRDLITGAPRLRFVHGFEYGGMAAITRANDPFWNVRAFGDVVSQHDGYKFPEFICALDQLVMDGVVGNSSRSP